MVDEAGYRLSFILKKLTLIGCSVRLWKVPMLKLVDTSDHTGDNSGHALDRHIYLILL
jgi:hypothetical protein